MSRLIYFIASIYLLSTGSAALAASDNHLPQNRSQSVINAFQVMCTLELPNFEHISAKATAMKMGLQVDEKQASLDDVVTRRKSWVGNLTTGPFVLFLDEMSGSKGKSTACAVAAVVPDTDMFRSEAVTMIKLQTDPKPEIDRDGSRSFVWNGVFGPESIVILRDFKPIGKPGVMLKLLNHVSTHYEEDPLMVEEGYRMSKSTPAKGLSRKSTIFKYKQVSFKLTPPNGYLLQEMEQSFGKVFSFIDTQDSEKRSSSMTITVMMRDPNKPPDPALGIIATIMAPFEKRLVNYSRREKESFDSNGLFFQGASFSGQMGAAPIAGAVFVTSDQNVIYIFLGFCKQGKAGEFDAELTDVVKSFQVIP